jgi:RNA polymerase sigma-70 factor (ECF subfamily)
MAEANACDGKRIGDSNLMTGSERPVVPDAELVRRVQADPSGAAGRAAAEELFGRYHGRVYAWCLRRVRNRDEAYDLAQDVMLNAYRALPGFAGEASFSTWLYVIARNRCRRAMRRPSLLRDEEQEPDTMPDRGAAPDDEALGRVEQDDVLDLMRSHLDPREQLALWLRCYEGMEVGEITESLGIAGASGARGVLQSARRKLRAALERRGARGE